MRKTGCVALCWSLFLAAPAPAADGTDARAVIDRAIRATGGEARLGRLKAAEWTCKGTAHASTALAFTEHWFAQWPGQVRHESAIEVMGQKFERALILNGDHGWIKQDKNTVTMTDATRDELRDKVHVLRVAATLLPLKEKGITLKPLDEVKIDGRLAAGVLASCTGRPDLALYFDKKNGLLVKCERTVKDPLSGKVTEEISFSDYQEVDGVQVAHKVTVTRGGRPFLDWTVTDFQVRAKLDRELFSGH